MAMELSIAPLYLLGHDDSNNVQNNSFGQVMPLMLVSVSHDANSVINGQDNQNEMQHDIQSCDAIGISIM